MDEAKRAALAAAGWRLGDAGDFLEMPDDERRVVELRVQVGLAVRRRRTAAGATQAELAGRLGSSQSRVNRVEGGLPGVSLDLAFRALFAVGGGLRDLAGKPGLPELGSLPADATGRTSSRGDDPDPSAGPAAVKPRGGARRPTAGRRVKSS